MDDATFYVLFFGGIMIAFGVFSLFFSSDYAQRKFNPDNAPFGTLRNKPQAKIIVDDDYRVRAK